MVVFQAQVKILNRQRLKPQTNSQDGKKEQQLKFLFTALSSGNIQTVLEYIENGM